MFMDALALHRPVLSCSNGISNTAGRLSRVSLLIVSMIHSSFTVFTPPPPGTTTAVGSSRLSVGSMLLQMKGGDERREEGRIPSL